MTNQIHFNLLLEVWFQTFREIHDGQAMGLEATFIKMKSQNKSTFPLYCRLLLSFHLTLEQVSGLKKNEEKTLLEKTYELVNFRVENYGATDYLLAIMFYRNLMHYPALRQTAKSEIEQLRKKVDALNLAKRKYGLLMSLIKDNSGDYYHFLTFQQKAKELNSSHEPKTSKSEKHLFWAKRKFFTKQPPPHGESDSKRQSYPPPSEKNSRRTTRFSAPEALTTFSTRKKLKLHKGLSAFQKKLPSFVREVILPKLNSKHRP